MKVESRIQSVRRPAPRPGFQRGLQFLVLRGSSSDVVHIDLDVWESLFELFHDLVQSTYPRPKLKGNLAVLYFEFAIVWLFEFGSRLAGGGQEGYCQEGEGCRNAEKQFVAFGSSCTRLAWGNDGGKNVGGHNDNDELKKLSMSTRDFQPREAATIKDVAARSEVSIQSESKH
jgi:hypothetical protein